MHNAEGSHRAAIQREELGEWLSLNQRFFRDTDVLNRMAVLDHQRGRIECRAALKEAKLDFSEVCSRVASSWRQEEAASYAELTKQEKEVRFARLVESRHEQVREAQQSRVAEEQLQLQMTTLHSERISKRLAKLATECGNRIQRETVIHGSSEVGSPQVVSCSTSNVITSPERELRGHTESDVEKSLWGSYRDFRRKQNLANRFRRKEENKKQRAEDEERLTKAEEERQMKRLAQVAAQKNKQLVSVHRMLNPLRRVSLVPLAVTSEREKSIERSLEERQQCRRVQLGEAAARLKDAVARLAQDRADMLEQLTCSPSPKRRLPPLSRCSDNLAETSSCDSQKRAEASLVLRRRLVSVASDTSLALLDMSDVGPSIGTRDMYHVESVLQECRHVKEVNVSSCCFDEEQTELMLRIALECPNITSFVADGTMFSPPDAAALLQEIAEKSRSLEKALALLERSRRQSEHLEEVEGREVAALPSAIRAATLSFVCMSERLGIDQTACRAFVAAQEWEGRSRLKVDFIAKKADLQGAHRVGSDMRSAKGNT